MLRFVGAIVSDTPSCLYCRTEPVVFLAWTRKIVEYCDLSVSFLTHSQTNCEPHCIGNQ